jgi:hypothetical protein
MTFRDTLGTQRRETTPNKFSRQPSTTMRRRDNQMVNEAAPTVVPAKNRRDQLALRERHQAQTGITGQELLNPAK